MNLMKTVKRLINMNEKHIMQIRAEDSQVCDELSEKYGTLIVPYY